MQELEQKNQEYLNYIQNHYNNVQQAWKIIQKIAPEYINDEWIYTTINNDIKNHDQSKLSNEEFQPYRNKFYPCANEPLDQAAYDKAWEHHLQHNSHHWQTWTKMPPPYQKPAFIHMLCDWLAMSLAKNEKSPLQYYESNKAEIFIPEWAINDIYIICDRLEK